MPRIPSAKEVLFKLVANELGLDLKRLDASTYLLSGPMADELDITELFLDAEERFGIQLSDDETEGVDTVGGLWELVARKLSTR